MLDEAAISSGRFPLQVAGPAVWSLGEAATHLRLMVARRESSDRYARSGLVVSAASGRQLAIERFAILQAPSQELWPRRNGGLRVRLFGQQSPQFRMMPAKLVPGAVAMFPDAGAKPFHFPDERVSIEVFEVVVHGDALSRILWNFVGTLSSLPACWFSSTI